MMEVKKLNLALKPTLMAKEIGKLSMELSALKESVMEVKVKLGESVSVLKVQIGKKE